MELDVDYLIDFFKKYSSDGNTEEKVEVGEQEAAGGAPSGGAKSGVPKWADSYQMKRGKANPLMRSGEKWQTGLLRGPANQIW